MITHEGATLFVNRSMDNIVKLIVRSFREPLTAEEQQELDQWRQLSDENKRFLEQYTDEVIASRVARMAGIDWEAGYSRFMEQYGPAEPPVVPLRSTRWAWVAAAVILLLLAGGAYFTWFNRQSGSPGKATTHTNPSNHDISPGSYKALLTLDDTTDLQLDTVTDLTLLKQGSTASRDKDVLVYQQPGALQKPDKVTWNTVSTPKGGYYRVVLPDGTRAWLNAASSIRFPTMFRNGERRVELTGEVYLEVAKDPAKPFLATVKGVTVEVLGTHFNINAYEDEAAIAATLLEGSVKVSSALQGAKLLSPGQQAQLLTGSQVSRVTPIGVRNVNVDEVTAWKNGYFQFEGSDIKTIMRQVARWYNVDIVYEASISHDFVGTINRNEPVSRLLQLLEMTDEVHFSIEGRTIHVKP